MRTNHTEVTDSQSARAITAYTKDLALTLGLTLKTVRWECLLSPDPPQDAYYLCISILQPFQADPIFRFTREQVLGYAASMTKAAITTEIRDDLEARCYVHGEDPPAA